MSTAYHIFLSTSAGVLVVGVGVAVVWMVSSAVDGALDEDWVSRAGLTSAVENIGQVMLLGVLLTCFGFTLSIVASIGEALLYVTGVVDTCHLLDCAPR